MALTDRTLGRAVAETIATAVDASTTNGETHYATAIVAMANEPDPLAWLTHHAPLAGVSRRQYWEQPDQDLAIAGVGSAVEIVAESRDRFGSAAAAVRGLADRCHGAARPVMLGGFAFTPSGPSNGRWAPFGAGRLRIPVAVLRRQGTSCDLVLTVPVSPGSEPHAVAAALDHLADRYSAPGRPLAPPASSADDAAATLAGELGDRDHYRRAVADAVRDIDDGEIAKVVVARRVDIPQRPAIVPLLATLREAYPTCATFLLEEEGRCFVGATPERLLATDGGRIWTAALAASAPRDPNPAIDDALGHALLASPKERAEHDFVVQAVRSGLEATGVEVESIGRPSVVKLAAIQHLYTPISGDLPSGTGILELVGALHPTPAVAGVPTDVARRWLDAHEDLDRGWYASPVGWLDLDGRGEFRVALRSGLVHDTGTALYVGAGVVAGSDPARELTETDIKLRAMLGPVLAVS